MTENAENQNNNVEPHNQQESTPTKSEPNSADESPKRSVKSLLIFLIVLIGLSWFVIQDMDRAKNIW